MALFGAPVAHEDDAERAVRAALRMQETLAAYADESGAGIRMRIGVNTGEVLVGALRAGGDYTAMGDVVNTASRLQTLAEPGEVLVGESTHIATSDVIGYESRGALVARGREQPVNVWTAVSTLLPPGYRPRHRESPLVGRDGEMAILSNAGRRVSITHGRGQVLLILGEAGVGKTRLANELAEPAKLEHGPNALQRPLRPLRRGQPVVAHRRGAAVRHAGSAATSDLAAARGPHHRGRDRGVRPSRRRRCRHHRRRQRPAAPDGLRGSAAGTRRRPGPDRGHPGAAHVPRGVGPSRARS